MKTKHFFLYFLVFASFQMNVQSQEWLWAESFGWYSFEVGHEISTDSAGYIYSTGNFNMQSEFGSHTIYSNGLYDIFVQKLDPDGNCIWVNNAGGISTDFGYGLATDEVGNSYITGHFRETASFDDIQITSYDSVDIFVAKIDTDGNWLWAAGAGGAGWDQGLSITFDSTGNSYVTGFFQQTATFGSTVLTSLVDRDLFIAKLDPDGNWLWAVNAGSETYEGGAGIEADRYGNIYATGYFDNTGYFGPFTISSNGGYDVFVAKLDQDGNWIWVNNAGGSQNDEGKGISVDYNGYCYLTGVFYGVASFGPNELTSDGLGDIFIAKLDPEGNWIWAEKAGGNDFDAGYDIYTDPEGNSYIAAHIRSNTATFGDVELSSYGGFDASVAKVDIDGKWIWANNGGGSGYDFARGITADKDGNAYVSGSYYDFATFGSHNIVSEMLDDIFVAKITDDPVSIRDNNDTGQASIVLSNYPNPFTGSTSIVIDAIIESGTHLELEIYNVLGEKVETIPVAVEVFKGMRTINWNGANYPAGMYFYKLNTENSPVSKMILR